LSFGQQPTAILDFEGKGINQIEASALTDRLRSELYELNVFPVIERGLMEEILNEQGFQQSGCTSDECVVEVGKIIGVKQMIGGSISKIGNIFSVSARIVDVETGEIIKIVTYDYEGKIGGLLREGMYQVALQIIGKETIKSLRGTGSVYITSIPSEANVVIDDQKLDRVTPISIEGLSAGEHKIILTKNHYYLEKSFSLFPLEAKRLHYELPIKRTNISISSVPDSAEVLIDQTRVGITPITVTDLEIGKHLIQITKKGYSPKQEYINLLSDFNNQYTFQLKSVSSYIQELEQKITKFKRLQTLSISMTASFLLTGLSQSTKQKAIVYYYISYVSLAPTLFIHFKIADLSKEIKTIQIND